MRASASTVMAKPLTHLNDNDLCYNCRDWLKANKLKLYKFMGIVGCRNERVSSKRSFDDDFHCFCHCLHLNIKGKKGIFYLQCSSGVIKLIYILDSQTNKCLWQRELSMFVILAWKIHNLEKIHLSNFGWWENSKEKQKESNNKKKKRIFHLHDKCMNLLSVVLFSFFL